MNDVYIETTRLFGEMMYRVYVDGKRLDMFFSKTWLTNSEVYDIASYYAESLTGRDLPDRIR